MEEKIWERGLRGLVLIQARNDEGRTSELREDERMDLRGIWETEMDWTWG